MLLLLLLVRVSGSWKAKAYDVSEPEEVKRCASVHVKSPNASALVGLQLQLWTWLSRRGHFDAEGCDGDDPVRVVIDLQEERWSELCAAVGVTRGHVNTTVAATLKATICWH